MKSFIFPLIEIHSQNNVPNQRLQHEKKILTLASSSSTPLHAPSPPPGDAITAFEQHHYPPMASLALSTTLPEDRIIRVDVICIFNTAKRTSSKRRDSGIFPPFEGQITFNERVMECFPAL